MAHWLDGVANILKSSDLNIINLAKLANVDPTDLYQHIDLSQCDLRGQDLRTIDFTGSLIEGALLDTSTKLDPKFDPRSNSKSYFFFPINARLVRYINSEAHQASYSYAIWYAKYLFEMLYNVKSNNQFKELLNDLYELDTENFYSITTERNVKRSIQIPNAIKNWIVDYEFRGMGNEKYSFLLFACLVFRLQYQYTSASKALESLIEREEKFRDSRVYLSGF
jgi:hypothetical protein